MVHQSFPFLSFSCFLFRLVYHVSFLWHKKRQETKREILPTFFFSNVNNDGILVSFFFVWIFSEKYVSSHKLKSLTGHELRQSLVNHCQKISWFVQCFYIGTLIDLAQYIFWRTFLGVFFHIENSINFFFFFQCTTCLVYVNFNVLKMQNKKPTWHMELQ